MKVKDLIKVKASSILLLWAIIFALIGVILLIFSFSGIAIAVTLFTKILFVLSFVCFLISGLLYFFKKEVKVIKEKDDAKP